MPCTFPALLRGQGYSKLFIIKPTMELRNNADIINSVLIFFTVSVQLDPSSQNAENILLFTTGCGTRRSSQIIRILSFVLRRLERSRGTKLMLTPHDGRHHICFSGNCTYGHPLASPVLPQFHDHRQTSPFPVSPSSPYFSSY